MAATIHPANSSTVFSIQSNTLKFDTLASIQPYLDQLDEITELEEIRLSGNTLGIDACAGVAMSLETKRKLKVADFSDIFTGRLISEIPPSLRSLCTSLLPLPSLTSLDLSDNAFGGRSVEPMIELLSTHTALKIVKLNNNGMGPVGGATIAGAFLKNALKAKSEGRTPSLHTIICGRNRLENSSAQAFADAFSALGSLIEVRMPQNGIRMEGIELIVTALRHNTGLKVLDLQDNTATEKGSRAIAASLPSWPHLTSLNLSDCLLRPRGGITLCKALSLGSNPLLTSLKLQSNELDARAIALLASAIEVYGEGLVEVELNGNRGEEGDECYERVRGALEKWGHADALDQLDELEDDEEDEEDEEEEEEEEKEEEEEEEEKEEETVVTGLAETGGEDVRANEAKVVRDDKVKENEEEPKEKETEQEKEEDELAGLLEKVKI